MNRWCVGIDFGRQADRTAVVAVEIVLRPDQPKAPFLDVRYANRLPVACPYPTQVSMLCALLDSSELASAEIALDATGVGVAVVDLLREQLHRSFTELTITGGNQAVVEGRRVSVPKRDLVSRLSVAMQTRRLRVSPGLADAAVLRAELGNFGVRVSDGGHDSYGSRSGHDDLVLATSYAVWLADQPNSAQSWIDFYRRRTGQTATLVGGVA